MDGQHPSETKAKCMVKGCKWIMNLGEFRANCADRKGISMNNSLFRGPDHLPPTSSTLFLTTQPPSPLMLSIDPHNLSLPFSCSAITLSVHLSQWVLSLFMSKWLSIPRSSVCLFSAWCFCRQTNPGGRGGGKRGGGSCVRLFFSPFLPSRVLSPYTSSQLEVVNI